MGFTLADQYYIKAFDFYPFNLAESIENLNYALSYNKNHAHANCLMGRLYSEYMNNPELAAGYFEQALSQDLANLDVIKHYTFFLIKQREFEKADKMIEYAFKIKGVNRSLLFRYKSLMAEYHQKLKKAEKILKSAINESCSEYETNFLKKELSRIEDKMKMKKKSTQKRKMKSSKKKK